MHPGRRIASAGLASLGAVYDFDFSMGASENKKPRARRGQVWGSVPVRHRADYDRWVHFFGCVAATRGTNSRLTKSPAGQGLNAHLPSHR
jgi:hypothetical protein